VEEMKYEIIIIIITVFIISAYALVILNSSKEEVTTFVTERTVSTTEDLLFNYDTIKYPSSAQVVAPIINNTTVQLGMNIDPTGINFGIIPGNGSFSKRFVNLTNTEDKDVKVFIETLGPIEPYVNFSMNDFVLRGKEKVVVKVYFYTTEAAIGNYSGEIDIITKKPKYDFAYLFW
jgi:hypothetical protein